MFEIKSADEVGMFEVSAKFMGVAMEKVELVFQVRALGVTFLQPSAPLKGSEGCSFQVPGKQGFSLFTFHLHGFLSERAK